MSDDFPGDEGMSPMSEKTFPDGFGMSVEDVRALLAKKHDVSVPQDDPILMQVTILQVFLEAQARLQKKHETALAAFMGQQTTAYVNDMEKNLKSLTETLSGLTMEGIRKAVADFVANLATHRSAMYLCTGHHSPFRLAQCRRLYPGDGASWMSVCWKALNTTAGH